MRSTTRITRKGLRRQKHSEPKMVNPAAMSLADILAEADEILARQRHIDQAHEDHPLPAWMVTHMTPELFVEARDWLQDCFGAGCTKGMTANEIMLTVSRYYDGGWSEFVRNSV